MTAGKNGRMTSGLEDPAFVLEWAIEKRETSNEKLSMAEPYLCAICGKIEEKCDCEPKYCILCQGAHDVRLVQDGLWYCRECREACDYTAQV